MWPLLSATDTDSQQQSYEQLQQENTQLRAQLLQDEMYRLIKDHILAENLELKDSASPDAITAGIVRKPPITLPGTVLLQLDPANAQSISIQDRVEKGNNAAMGTVAQKEGSILLVDLYSKPDRETVVSLNGLSVTLLGRGAGVFQTRTPRSFEVTVGDMAVLPVVDSGIVAQVVDVSDNPQDPELQVTLQSLVNINAIDYLEVLPNSAIDTSLIQE